MIKIGLCGASGKMGSAVVQAVAISDKCQLIGRFSTKDAVTELANICKNSDVIIDFSSPDLLATLLATAAQYNTKLVIGTTGFRPEHFQILQEAARTNTILYSANMSFGANLVANLASTAASALNEDYDIDITDIHHRFKKDAPSGTSLMYGQLLSTIRNIEYCLPNNQSSTGAERQPNTIGYASIRAGHMIGEHIITFSGQDDVITIKHQAFNRAIYANGAVCAAFWVQTKPHGLYSMLDLVSDGQL